MKNRARIPYHARAKAFRWTRPPAPKPVDPPPLTLCNETRHVWVTKGGEPQPTDKCDCGKCEWGGYA